MYSGKCFYTTPTRLYSLVIACVNVPSFRYNSSAMILFFFGHTAWETWYSTCFFFELRSCVMFQNVERIWYGHVNFSPNVSFWPSSSLSEHCSIYILFLIATYAGTQLHYTYLSSSLSSLHYHMIRCRMRLHGNGWCEVTAVPDVHMRSAVQRRVIGSTMTNMGRNSVPSCNSANTGLRATYFAVLDCAFLVKALFKGDA